MILRILICSKGPTVAPQLADKPPAPKLPEGLDFFWIPLTPGVDGGGGDGPDGVKAGDGEPAWEPCLPDPVAFLKLAFQER